MMSNNHELDEGDVGIILRADGRVELVSKVTPATSDNPMVAQNMPIALAVAHMLTHNDRARMALYNSGLSDEVVSAAGGGLLH